MPKMKIFILPILLCFYGPYEALGAFVSLEDVQSTRLEAGGEWGIFFEPQIGYNKATNRLLTVVRTGSPNPDDYYRLLNFDVSTKGLASQTPLPGFKDEIPMDLEISAGANDAFIAWGSSEARLLGTERELPTRLLRWDLDVFEPTASVEIPVRFHQFAVDEKMHRLLGIAEPTVSASAYEFAIVNLGTNVVQSFPLRGIGRDDYIVKDLVFDASRETIFSLVAPTQPGDPNKVQLGGFIHAYSASQGALIQQSPHLPGTFGQNSLTMSSAQNLIAVGNTAGSATSVYLLDADNLSLQSIIRKSDLPTDFDPNGSIVFSGSRDLWIANASESDPQRSVAVYDTENGVVSRTIANASRSLALEADPISNSIFIGSKELQSLYILPATTKRLTAQMDLSAKPVDMDYDPIADLVRVLTQTGRFYLVEDHGSQVPPRLVMRLFNFGEEPQSGIVRKPSSGEVILGRRRDAPPRVYETLAYDQVGELPRPAVAVVVDSSRNLIYAVERMAGFPARHVITGIDGDSLQIVSDVASFSARGTVTGIELDEDREALWVLTQGNFDSSQLRRFDLNTGASDEIAFPFGSVSELVPDFYRNRILLVFNPAGGDEDAEVRAYNTLSLTDVPTETIPLGADFVADSQLDTNHDLVYYLTQREDNGVWSVTVLDLLSNTLESSHDLEFLASANAAGMAFNPFTNRFAILHSPKSTLHIFDNPTSSTRRPGPEQDSKVGSQALVGAIKQSQRSVRLDWELSSDPESVEGWMVERKREFESVSGDLADWIRLTPFPLPTDVKTWTDVTVEASGEYSYRVSPLVNDETPILPLLLGPIQVENRLNDLNATIPQAAVAMLPGSTRDLTLLVTIPRPRSERPLLTTDEAGPITITFPTERVNLPGTSRIRLHAAEEVDSGVHAVKIELSETIGDPVSISLLVRVVKPEQRVRKSDVLRWPAVIRLTSDSSLDQERVAVRGQLGISRELTVPSEVEVKVRTSLGELLTAETVVAPTGEFTAEFDVPENNIPGENWFFLATWAGSLDYVGGESLPFAFPVFTSFAKGESATPEIDLGRVVLTVGSPLGENTPSDMELLESRLEETFFQQRFSKQREEIFSPKTRDEFLEASLTAADETDRYELIFMVGDARRVGDDGLEFLLASGESINSETLSTIIKTISEKVTPLVVIECPHSARFEKHIGGLERGAIIFTARDGFGSDRFFYGPRQLNYADAFHYEIRDGKGFGETFSFLNGLPNFHLLFGLIEGQNPKMVEANPGEYADLKLGSHLTPSRSLLADRIEPTFLSVEMPSTAEIGERITIQAMTEDAPFGMPVNVEMEIFHPDGKTENIVLSSVDHSERQVGEVTARMPGGLYVTLTASDIANNQVAFTSKINVETHGMSFMEAEDLLQILGGFRRENRPIQGMHYPTADDIFGASMLWHLPLR